MPEKRYTPEQIVAKLRQVDVAVAQGQSIAQAVKAIGVTETTFYRWRSEYGGLRLDQVKRLKELETENMRLRKAVTAEDEAALTADIIALAREYGRYGYRRITAMLRDAGWAVNRKRVERIWRREGLKVPSKQPKRGRLWLADGSCIRLRPERPNHVWAYDFIEDRTHDGRKFRALCVLDEFTRRCLAIVVRRRFSAHDVVEVLAELMIVHGVPEHIRSDQGSEFLAKVVQDWIRKVGAKTAYIEKGSPWENGYVESFHSKFRDELLDREIFYSLREAQVL